MSVQALQGAPKRARFEEPRQQDKIRMLPLTLQTHLQLFLDTKEVFGSLRVCRVFGKHLKAGQFKQQFLV